MYPEIPEDVKLARKSPAQLRSLAEEIRVAAKAAHEASKAEDFDGDRAAVRAEVAEKLAERTRIRELADELEAEIAADEALNAELAEPQPELEVETDEVEDELEEVEDAEEEKVEVTASAPAPKIRSHVGTPASAGADSVPEASGVVGNQMVRVDGSRAGQPFSDMTEVAAALIERASTLSSMSDTRYPVAKIPGQFRRTVSGDWKENLSLFEDQDELTAALCAPLPPTYNIGCQNSTARPVKASIPVYGVAEAQARGGVKIYSSPTLSQITTGVGQWTAADDANLSAEKEDCQRITCGSTTDYVLYGIYRCMTVQNMLQMTFPELVEAWLNRLAAAQARLAETLLLEAMAASTDTVFAETQNFNATTTVTRSLLQYLTARREIERWDDVVHDVWLHRSILTALKADHVSRRNTSGGFASIPSDAQINGLFNDAGFAPHWFMDRPSWMTPIPAFDVGGKLGAFPRNIEMLVAPRGKFRLLDRGNLSIGVTGNGIYRDNESNKHNNFTFFVENFEGLVDTDSCPAHILEINNVCWNGQQIADVILDCEGQDEPGQQS